MNMQWKKWILLVNTTVLLSGAGTVIHAGAVSIRRLILRTFRRIQRKVTTYTGRFLKGRHLPITPWVRMAAR